MQTSLKKHRTLTSAVYDVCCLEIDFFCLYNYSLLIDDDGNGIVYKPYLLNYAKQMNTNA